VSNVEVIQGAKARAKTLCITDLAIGNDSEAFLQKVTQKLIVAAENKAASKLHFKLLLMSCAESRDVKFRFSAIAPRSSITPSLTTNLNMADVQHKAPGNETRSAGQKRKAQDATSTIRFTSRNPPWTYLKLQL
jgi:hypothetical protein